MTFYVYALTSGPLAPPAPRGIGGRRLRSVRVGRVYAAVEPVSPRRRHAGVPPTASALARQQAVVAALAARAEALLPVRFGAVVEEAELAALVTRGAAALGRALALVRGREQMTLRVFRRRGRGTAPRARPRAGRPMSGVEYLRRVRRLRRRAESLPELRDLETALKPIVRARTVQRHDAGLLVGSVYHLIDRGAGAAYRRIVAARARAATVRVVASGPWPPYAFAPEVLA